MNVRAFPLVTDQVDYREIETILCYLKAALERTKAGAVVEFGCYEGTASLFIQRFLQEEGNRREFHVYDSFEGLPPKSPQDQSPAGIQFTAGALQASRKTFIRNFKRAGLPLPVIHKNWFAALKPHDIPAQIAFAFLDGDFYESIKQSLALIEPALVPGACIVIDDYMSESLPGAAKATDEWLAQKNYARRSERSLAVIEVPA